ncbi:MAG: glycosyltransferase, partial [Chloroflexi bacterium]|nr:glycosyltransferase [Chloroflexota bacterium]
MERERPSDAPQIAYLIKCFPRLSETFILHEVLELERQGLPLRIFSLLEPTGKVNQAAQEVQARVTYFPRGFPMGWLTLIAAALRRFLKNPWLFLKVCLAAMIRFHDIATPRHILYAAYLAEQLEQASITHLHAHYANTPATVALLAHQFAGIPFSFTAHAKDIYLSRRESLAYKMRGVRSLAHMTALENAYGLALRVFPRRIAGVAAPRARPLILTVARLVEKKGLVYLLQACRELFDRGYDVNCRIIGEGPLRATLEQQIRDLALGDRVELCGAETHERVIEMYRQATLFALPSIVAENGDRDGIPNVLAESLYMGVPVISTPVFGIPELIQSERNGLLVPARDSAALAAAIAQLLDSPRLCQRLATAGRETVLAHFDMSANAQRLLSLFLNQEHASAKANQIATCSHQPANLGGVQLGGH